MHVPLPIVEVWEELQAEVEHVAGLAGLRIISGVIEEEVTRRVGPRTNRGRSRVACVGGVNRVSGVCGRKVGMERPRVRAERPGSGTGQLRAAAARRAATASGAGRDRRGVDSRNYRRAVQSVLEGYGIEKSSVSREFVAASAAHCKAVREKAE